MNTPRGFNPVGEHAPGLPRHDAPLPGHVSGHYQPLGGGDQPSLANAPTCTVSSALEVLM